MELPISDSIIIAISKLIDDAKIEPKREPTHYDLDVQIKKAGLTAVDPKSQGQSVGKAKRIRAILNWAIENNQSAGGELIGLIISQVRGVGGFRESSPNFVGKEQILNAIGAFESENFSLSENGDIRPKVLGTLKGNILPRHCRPTHNEQKKDQKMQLFYPGQAKIF